jgi:hypothetical protein
MRTLAEKTAPVKLRPGLRGTWDKVKWALAWLTWAAWFAVIESLALRAGKGTLSEMGVRVFRTDTNTGALIWMLVSAIGGAALTKHIIDFGHVIARRER